MKTIETLLAAQAAQEQSDALDQARREVVGSALRTYQQIGFHVEAVADLCARFGKTTLLEGLEPAVREAVEALLEDIRPLWEEHSPVPFPDLPDEPVASAPPAEGGENP